MDRSSETLPALLHALAARDGDRPALAIGDRRFAFRDIERDACRVAGGLQRLGIGPGDRIAVWLPNDIEWFVLLFAAARLGALVVAVNTRFRSAEVEYLLGKSRAKLLVYQPDYRGIDFPEILRGIRSQAVPDLATIVSVGAAPRGALADGPTYDTLRQAEPLTRDFSRPDALVIAFTTSGTTSKPKIVAHRQQAIVRHTGDAARGFALDRPDTRLLALLPLCGTFGFCSVLAAFQGGAEVVLQSQFEAQAAARILAERYITHSFGSDDMFAPILGCAAGDKPFPALRALGFAAFRSGARELVESAQRRHVRMVGLYGSSEVHALFARQPFDAPLERRALGGGIAVAAEAEIRVRDPSSAAIVGVGVSGEVEIRSPTMLPGYLDDPEATARAFTEDGFFRTGDVGHMTQDGGFVFESRMGDALRLSGFLVNPSEIEDILKENDGVADAQVVGIPVDGVLRPVAFVIPTAGGRFDEPALLDHARHRMARFKVPYKVVALAEFPTTPSANGAKVQKTALREIGVRLLDAGNPERRP